MISSLFKSSIPRWTFWPEKEFTDVYENIYVRTLAEDWFTIVNTIASEFNGCNTILDIGCGEGHTTKQILDRIETPYECDLLEPNRVALRSATTHLSKENKIGKTYAVGLDNFSPERLYDGVFTSHTNYYWASTESSYKQQLKKFIGLVRPGGKALLLGLPTDSDHYSVLTKETYPQFVRTEYAVSFFSNQGHNVRVVPFSMRLYVGDFFTTKSEFDLRNFYRFMHSTETKPSIAELGSFRGKIHEVAKEGYLNFKDNLLVVTRKS